MFMFSSALCNFPTQGLLQIPAANYLQQMQTKYAAIIQKVPAFLQVMRRLLVDGEQSLRETFLAAKAALPLGSRHKAVKAVALRSGVHRHMQ